MTPGGCARHDGDGGWLYHPDLVAAVDAVVGKIGYSTVAETCGAREAAHRILERLPI